MERGKKNIHIFIILKIEVPPVIINSTVGRERLENLNMISTAFQLQKTKQKKKITVLFFFFLNTCFLRLESIKSISSSACDCLRALEAELKERDRWGTAAWSRSTVATTAHTHSFKLQIFHPRGGGSGEAGWWGTNSNAPPTSHHHHHRLRCLTTHKPQSTVTQPMSSSGASTLRICPFYKSTINSS